MAFEQLKDTMDKIKNAPYEAKRGAIIGAICIAVSVAPFAVMHHYSNKANNYMQITNQNNEQIKKLQNKTQKKVKTAKVRLLNAPQTQKKIEKNVEEVSSLQLQILKYVQNPKKYSTQDKQDAYLKMQKFVNSNALLTTDGLIMPMQSANGITINASYQPSFSVTDDNIEVMFHYYYHNKPIYIIDGIYNLASDKFTGFGTYGTSYTYMYMRNPKSLDENKVAKNHKVTAKEKESISKKVPKKKKSGDKK